MQTSRGTLLLPLIFGAVVSLAPGSSAAVVAACNEAELRNALTTGEPIQFGCDGTIVLSNSIPVTTSVSLDANAHNVTLSGGGKVRIFEVNSTGFLSMLGLTLADGLAQGARGTFGEPGLGGAVLVNQGQLQATDCRFLNNMAAGGNGTGAFGGAGRGGAIFISQGLLWLTNCVLSQNQVVGASGTEAGGAACAAQDSDVTVIGCQVRNNRATGGQGQGGAFPAGKALGGGWQQLGGSSLFSTTLFVTNTAVVPDPFGLNALGADAMGGGLLVENGVSVLKDCVFEHNSAKAGGSTRAGPAGFGGGGAVANKGNMELRACTFRGNSATSGEFDYHGNDAGGGAIHNLGSVVLQGCLVDANSAVPGKQRGLGSAPPLVVGGFAMGGGIWNGGSAHLIDSAVINNEASGIGAVLLGPFSGYRGLHGYGGGIVNTANLSGVNVTLAANKARGGNSVSILSGFTPTLAGDAYGGGIYQSQGDTRLTNWTIAGNCAAAGNGMPDGGRLGENLNIAAGTFSMVNSLVANPGSGSNCVGTITDYGHNIASDASCHFMSPGSHNDTDPKLGPLASYEGATPTMAILVGSPALDSAATDSSPAFDQRGRVRPFGPGGDIGAFESSPPYAAIGYITGWLGPSANIHVSVGTHVAAPDPGGLYVVNGLDPGTHLVTPASPTSVFLQSNAVVTLGPERLTSFRSYRSNALTLEINLSPGIRMVFAGEAGRTYRLFGSSGLLNWTPLQTNVMSAAGIFDYSEPINPSLGQRLYKVESP